MVVTTTVFIGRSGQIILPFGDLEESRIFV